MLTAQERTGQILIVDEDTETAEIVSAVLESAGFTTVSVATGDQALNEISAQRPALVLINLDLPEMDRLDSLRQMRAATSTPLIVLGPSVVGQKAVSAFEAGADGVIPLPCDYDELVARIKALLRRVNLTAAPEPKLVVRHLELDMARRQASIRGRKLHLTPIEYGILVTLMKNAGQTITHDELLRTVWGDQYAGDFSVLRVNISRLRQKLEENPRHPTYIVTVPGQGYTLPTRRA